MAVLVLTTFDTPENGRSWMTDKTLEGISRTVNFNTHRLVVVDNGSCFETTETLKKWSRRLGGEPKVRIVYNLVNAGQARAINEGWSTAKPGEVLARIDNDIFLRTDGWLDRLEWCILRDSKIGIIGLKHKDIEDHPEATDWHKTSLHLLPHAKGQSWLVVEKMNHVLGSVQAVNPLLFQKIGYLRQYAAYGWEDHCYAVRCQVAGFYSCVYHGAEFDDLDKAKVPAYEDWKRGVSESGRLEHDRMIDGYRAGTEDILIGSP